SRHRAECPILAPLVEPLPVWRFTGLDPGLAEHAVLEAAPGLVGGRRLPQAGDLRPAHPADRRVERRDVEPDRAGIPRLGHRPPLAGGKHCRLVVLLDPTIAGGAYIMCRLGPALVPAQPLESEPLHLPAVRAGHEVAAL